MKFKRILFAAIFLSMAISSVAASQIASAGYGSTPAKKTQEPEPNFLNGFGDRFQFRDRDREEFEAQPRPSDRAACRVRVGRGCGSGSVCGRFREGSLIITNAHVSGTRVGRMVEVDIVVDGEPRTFDARILVAAYSDKTLTDWAVLYAEKLNGIDPVKLSKKKPEGRHYTKGSPNCVWPLKTSDVTTVDVSDDSPLWRWRPNSIGGQSGSAVNSYRTHSQEGLLTWSWGGLGAGQQTSEMYRQAKERSVGGLPRPDGLKEVGIRAPEVVVENGFFAQQGIDDLPIWGDDGDDFDDPFKPDDGGDGFELSKAEIDLIIGLRKRSDNLEIDRERAVRLILGDSKTDQADAAMLRRLRTRARERGIDFFKLLQLALQLIELLGDR